MGVAITCLMMLWKINLLGSSTTMCTLILSRIRSNSITLFTSGTFHQKKWTQEAYDQSGWFSKEAETALAWTSCIYKGGKQVLCLDVEEIPPLLPSNMPGNAVYNTEADKSSVYLESNSKPSGAYMYTLNFSLWVTDLYYGIFSPSDQCSNINPLVPHSWYSQIHSVAQIIFVSIRSTCINGT